MNRTYLKTPKAREALRQTRSALPGVQRRLLILVDGKKDAATLVQQYQVYGMSEQALNALTSDGFLIAA